MSLGELFCGLPPLEVGFDLRGSPDAAPEVAAPRARALPGMRRTSISLPGAWAAREPVRARSRHRRAVVAITALAAWMALPEHAEAPYPTAAEARALAAEGGITERQVSYWFSNARKRCWKVCAARARGSGRAGAATRHSFTSLARGRSRSSWRRARRLPRRGVRGRWRGSTLARGLGLLPPTAAAGAAAAADLLRTTGAATRHYSFTSLARGRSRTSRRRARALPRRGVRGRWRGSTLARGLGLPPPTAAAAARRRIL
jgi:hypothetical protein